jgi:hypothetical protein
VRYILIGGVRYEWKEILKMRREQVRTTRNQQLVLLGPENDPIQLFKTPGTEVSQEAPPTRGFALVSTLGVEVFCPKILCFIRTAVR